MELVTVSEAQFLGSWQNLSQAVHCKLFGEHSKIKCKLNQKVVPFPSGLVSSYSDLSDLISRVVNGFFIVLRKAIFFFKIPKTFYSIYGYLYNSHYTNLLQINLFGLKRDLWI